MAIDDWRICTLTTRLRRQNLHTLLSVQRIQARIIPAHGLRLSSGMNPKTEALQERAHEFFLRVIAFCDSVPNAAAGRTICEQLLDSAGSVQSNYRAACKARSRREFIAKLGVAAEEADESLGWLRTLRDARLGDQRAVLPLITEANELTSIFVASAKTATRHMIEEATKRSRRRRARR